jgi:hypothetical protein
MKLLDADASHLDGIYRGLPKLNMHELGTNKSLGFVTPSIGVCLIF